MQKEVQKQNKIKTQSKTKKIIRDALLKIDNLVNNLGHDSAEINSKRLVHIIKYTFGELFNVHYEYTYEELIEKFETIDKKLSSISVAIKELKIKIDDTFIDEKNNPKLKEKIDEYEEKLLKEYQLEKFYNQLKSILSHEDLKELIQVLLQNISKIEYADEKITNDQLTDIIDKFKWILNKILSFEETEEKKKKLNFIGRILQIIGLHHREESKPKIEEPELAIKQKEESDKSIVSIKIKAEQLKTEKEPKTEELKPEVRKEAIKIEPKIKEDITKTAIKESGQSKIVQTPKHMLQITKIINQTIEELDKGNKYGAKKKYLKALNVYKKLRIEEKEQIYRQLLQVYHSILTFDINSIKK